MLTIRGLQCSYGSVPVVAEASFTVQPTELVAVIGRNGSGKSSLLRAIFGLVPAHGEIRVHGAYVTGAPDERVRVHGLGFLPQEDRVIRSLTAKGNLRLAASRRAVVFRREVERWLTDCRHSPVPGIAAPWNGLTRLGPFLEPLLARPADRLSGGEAAAVSLACTLLAARSYVVLDELSAGAAPDLLEIFGDVLREVACSGRYGVLFAEQDHGFVLRTATRILRLVGDDDRRGARVVGVPMDAVDAFRRGATAPDDLISWLDQNACSEPPTRETGADCSMAVGQLPNAQRS